MKSHAERESHPTQQVFGRRKCGLELEAMVATAKTHTIAGEQAQNPVQ